MKTVNNLLKTALMSGDLLRRSTRDSSALTRNNLNQRTPTTTLVDDILLNVLCWCDISSVISMSQARITKFQNYAEK
jgi:hypothetical protein